MTSSLLPDINVWVALHFDRHEHHRTVMAWFESLPEQQALVFCRQTQLGLFRLLTTAAVMGSSTLSQRACWQLYARWIAAGRAVLQDEPAGIGEAFRTRTQAATPSPKTWMDAYLAAFAATAGLTLVTFDKALAAKARGTLLLG